MSIENSTTVCIPRWAVRDTESHLYFCDGGARTIWTSSLSNAKFFHSRRHAESIAHLHRCEVVPASSEELKPPAPRPETNKEMLCRLIVEGAGAKFSGIQPAFTAKGIRQPALVLVTSKSSGSTLACPIRELCDRRVREMIAASDTEFDRYASNAVNRIFQNLAGQRAVVASQTEVTA